MNKLSLLGRKKRVLRICMTSFSICKERLIRFRFLVFKIVEIIRSEVLDSDSWDSSILCCHVWVS